MDNIAYIALSRQVAMQRQLDVIANNLANMNTTAFRGESILFEEYLVNAGAGQRKTSFVQDFGMIRDLREGELRPTGNPLDLAISGKGYFTVETPDGIRYTRNGQFRLDGEGRLTSNEGFPVLDDRGTPILLDPREGTPVVNRDGSISTPQAGLIGRIEVVEFKDEQRLQKTEGSLLTSDEQPTPVANPVVIQGMAESSNVTPIVEMTRMIELSRSYQSSQKILENDHERQRKAFERLSQVA